MTYYLPALPWVPQGTCCDTSPRSCKPASMTIATNRKKLPMTPSRLTAQSCLRRSEEHTSELQSLMRISYAVFCLKKTKKNIQYATRQITTRSSSYKENTRQHT